MAFWNKKQIALPMVPAKEEELVSLMETLGKGGLPLAINNEIQKMIDAASQFQAFENADDQGNFFGSEFNIRATAGRIKATYSREPWVFATATLVAKTLSTLPMQVVRVSDDVPLPNHPMQAKLSLGSPMQDNVTINWCGYLDLMLCGTFFRVFNETYTEMMQVPAEKVLIVLSDDKKSIVGIKVSNTMDHNNSKLIPAKYVVAHKFPNPWSNLYGMSLFTACARPIILDRFKNEFEMAFYLRGATNAGVIETTEDINKSRMERLMRTFEQVYTGKRNWWRTIFLPKGAKWIQSGLTMSEMQHLEGLRENRLTILAALGIPPSKVGLVQDVNRSTSDNQDKDFWENTIKPLANFIAAGWNNSYLVKTIYGGSIKIVPDYSGVSVLNQPLAQKGKETQELERVLVINELRELLDYPPLADERGNKFVAEITSAAQVVAPNPIDALLADLTTEQAMPQEQTTTLNFQYVDIKAQTVESQERVEKKLSGKYKDGYDAYINQMLDIAADALRNGDNVEKKLKSAQKKLAQGYLKSVEDTLVKALERGFTFANSTVKGVGPMGVVNKAPRFTAKDRQAIEALREEDRDGQRRALLTRSIESFVGFNENKTKQVLDLIADGVENGDTFETIAADLRSRYAEAYKDQAFTITRTEVLSAISQGMKWNHDVLGKVFTKTKKQWFHVGDVGSNPDARDNHADFEALGEVDSDFKWGNMLSYPRDPEGGPNEVINCRCSMTTVIPDDAESNADIILDSL